MEKNELFDRREFKKTSLQYVSVPLVRRVISGLPGHWKRAWASGKGI
jgi:hypothetical protein